MAFNNYDQNKNKNLEVTVYSGLSMGNKEASVDPSVLGFDFWNKLLKIHVSPFVKVNGEMKPDRENQGVVYLSPSKALILSQEIEQYLANPMVFKSTGVLTSSGGFVSLSNGAEFGSDKPCLVIRKIGENNEILFTYVYEFKVNSYAVRNFNESNVEDFDKIMYPNVEILQFKLLLEDYAKSMSGAVAYSVVEFGKYFFNRITNGSNNNGGGTSNNRQRGSSSMFDKAAPTKSSEYSQHTLDDINALME